jgi:HJR/Mrr/RecB family endonuclease
MDAEFDTIGLQFGFLMDTKLIFNKYNQEYKNAWLELLLDIEKTRDMKKVDDIEDTLLETINELVPEANNFFMDASQSGSLTHKWSRKAFFLLHPEFVKVEESKKTLLTEAKIEKATTQQSKAKPARILSMTRRKKVTFESKRATTRRR